MLNRKRNSPNETKSDKFLLKLYEILGKDEYSKIIHWNQNGTYIVITNIHILSKKILPIYFNHQNYSSFVRQLNMYNFHKIRTDPNKQEQYFINESLNKNKSINDILNFKRKEKKQKCLFFQDEDAKIKYTILPDKKNEELINLEEELDLDENNAKIEDKFNNLISDGKLNQNIKNKMMLYLLKKAKENMEQKNEIKNKLNELKEHSYVTNSQIQNLNEEVENQNPFLKKIKNLCFLLVNLLARKNNFNNDKNVETKINSTNNEINKKSGSKMSLSDFVHRYVNYRGKKDFLCFISSMNKNKLNSLNKKNNIQKKNYLSNIVQKGENFSIQNQNFNFDDYLNNFEMLSFKSRKSRQFNDSFSFSAEDKNFNSSFSMIDNNNLNNINFDNSNYKANQIILNDDILFWK